MRRLTSFLSLCTLMPALMLSAPGTAPVTAATLPLWSRRSPKRTSGWPTSVAISKSNKRASTVPW